MKMEIASLALNATLAMNLLR